MNLAKFCYKFYFKILFLFVFFPLLSFASYSNAMDSKVIDAMPDGQRLPWLEEKVREKQTADEIISEVLIYLPVSWVKNLKPQLKTIHGILRDRRLFNVWREHSHYSAVVGDRMEFIDDLLDQSKIADIHAFNHKNGLNYLLRKLYDFRIWEDAALHAAKNGALPSYDREIEHLLQLIIALNFDELELTFENKEAWQAHARRLLFLVLKLSDYGNHQILFPVDRNAWHIVWFSSWHKGGDEFTMLERLQTMKMQFLEAAVEQQAKALYFCELPYTPDEEASVHVWAVLKRAIAKHHIYDPETLGRFAYRIAEKFAQIRFLNAVDNFLINNYENHAASQLAFDDSIFLSKKAWENYKNKNFPADRLYYWRSPKTLKSLLLNRLDRIVGQI